MTEVADTRNIEAMDTAKQREERFAEGERISAMNEDQFKMYIKSLIVGIKGDKSLAGNHQARANSPESDCYNFDYPRRGLAIIYNNENFKDDGLEVRTGSSKDAKNLEKSFKSLGFDVLVFKDFKADYMIIAATEVAKLYKHKEADCFACVILSHGTEIKTKSGEEGVDEVAHVIYGYDKSAVFCDHIMNSFNDTQCEGLKDKPRLFFLQACRGDEMDSGAEISEGSGDPAVVSGNPPRDTGDDGTRVTFNPIFVSIDIPERVSRDEVDSELGPVFKYYDRSIKLVRGRPVPNVSDVRMLLIPMYTDTLVMYATPPGYFAWRRDSGSWFITELCKFLQSQQVLDHSFLQGLTSVNREVSQKYRSSTEDETKNNKLEMPMIDTMLTKKIIMAPKCCDLHEYTR